MKIYKSVNYFYPTSPNAVHFKMKNGGYAVNLVDEEMDVVETKEVFPDLQSACEYAEKELPEIEFSWLFRRFYVKSDEDSNKWVRI